MNKLVQRSCRKKISPVSVFELVVSHLFLMCINHDEEQGFAIVHEGGGFFFFFFFFGFGCLAAFCGMDFAGDWHCI